MKTAISVPDDTFARASQRAHELGLSRSEFFARAARRYLDQLDAESATQQIDQALAQLAQLDSPDESSADAVAVGHDVLATAADDEW